MFGAGDLCNDIQSDFDRGYFLSVSPAQCSAVSVSHYETPGCHRRPAAQIAPCPTSKAKRQKSF